MCSKRRGGRDAGSGFRLTASLALRAPAIIGVLGANGAGKTTLFDLIAGHESPAAGRVLCDGIDVHRVAPRQRGRLVNHRRQRHHIRGARGSFWNGFAAGGRWQWRLRPYRQVPSRRARVHLFDEPELDDGYFGLLTAYMRDLRATGNLVLVSVHPRDPRHVEMLRALCDGFVLVEDGATWLLPTFDELAADGAARRYLGDLLGNADQWA